MRDGAGSPKPRMPPLVLLVLAMALAWIAARAWPPGTWAMPGRTAVSLLLGAAGAAVALAGVLEFRRARTTVDPRHPERAGVLVHSGIYRVSRNPMYLGFALILAGWVARLGHVGALAVLVGYVLYIDVAQIEAEEAALRKRFGRAFEAYASRVGRWI